MSIEHIIGLLIFYILLREIKLIGQLQKKGERGYIYVFTDVGLILPFLKIGKTNNVQRRMSAHRTAAPLGTLHLSFPVENMSYVESYLHDKYHMWRLKGEWFFPNPLIFIDVIFLYMYFNWRK